MVNVLVSPVAVQDFLISGIPATGAKLFVYAAGTTNKITTYTDSTHATAQTNPIVMNSRGEPENVSGASVGIWVDIATPYKLVLAPSTDSDPPTNPIWTVDNIGFESDITYINAKFQFLGGTPPASLEVMAMYENEASSTFYANFNGTASGGGAAYGDCITNPTAPFVITVKKNNTSTVGTISIDTAGVFTFATSGGTSFTLAAGDYLNFIAQSSVDSTLANLSWTIPGVYN